MSMNIFNIGDEEDDDSRKFVKKWNSFKNEYVYKDVETKKLYSRKDFFLIRLTEEVMVINDFEFPPDDDDDDTHRRRGVII